MNIYASTNAQTDDPEPMVGTVTEKRYPVPFGIDRSEGNETAYHRPRDEYDRPRAHEGNPILIAARESYDGDPWGFALAWLDGVENYQAGFGYADADDAAQWGASHERIAVWQIAQGDGSWTLPAATEEHIEHAYRVFDRMADVARANGRDY